MTRIASLVAAGAIVLAATSAASAQFSVTLGNPASGRAATLNFGQPAYNYGYGFNNGYGVARPGAYNYGYGFGGPRVAYGAPGAFASPYAGYSTYGYTSVTPLAPGVTTYSSGYRGYTAPGTYIQQNYTTYPYSAYGNTGYGYGTGGLYGGGLNLNRIYGQPLR